MHTIFWQSETMLNWIKSLSKARKRTILLAVDCLLVPVALVFALWTVPLSGDMLGNFASFLPILPYVLAVVVGVSLWLGVSSVQLNAFESGAVGMTGIMAFCLTVASIAFANIAGIGWPIGLHLVFGATYFGMVVASRSILLQAVLAIYRGGESRCRVLIYGAGNTGTQLALALRSHHDIEPVAFVDDNQTLQGLRLNRLPVFSPLRVAEISREYQIDRVLLALPSLSYPKQLQIVRRLEKLGLEVQALPSFAQLVGSEVLVDNLTPVSAQAYLNRTEVSAALIRDENCYAGKTILVSGGGGSIGSELCRQLVGYGPKKLVVFEISELALYSIHAELVQATEGTKIEIIPVLGSVCDPIQVRKVLTEHQVSVVFHAAAYKHVPLVEANPLAGLANNVFSTQTLAQISVECGVERFLLVSSDKAVRPANVMGASKRLAEQVVQDLANRQPFSGGTIFSMVRFGNVLGSSGSVVPRFQEQLERGGPLTVTHRAVTRYFMTVQEAVSLVLQAGSMATGSEVFVLDMGEPVRIIDLARQVIEFAGYTLRDEENPEGDIEIKITGLRPGEKLREELTLSPRLDPTSHPKILAANEGGLSQIEVATVLRGLVDACERGDESAALKLLERWVEDFPNTADNATIQRAELSRSNELTSGTPSRG